MTLYLQPEQIAEVNATTEAGWRTDGHDTGVHASAFPITAYGQAALLRTALYRRRVGFEAKYAHKVRSTRHHFIDWVGWIEPAKFEAAIGTEFDLNYYHYWDLGKKTRFEQVGHRSRMLDLPTDKKLAHGYFTGSGLPQRFCDEQRRDPPVYQLLTEWSDEFFADNSYTALEVYQIIEDMLADAETGFYSAFVTNVHPARYAEVG